MPDMYDKLGDLLNEALESGSIPVEKQENSIESDITKDRDTSNSNCDKSGPFSFNENKEKETDKKKKKVWFFKKKAEKPTAEVIKMHKYTKIMQFPSEIQQALTTLDIAYPVNKLKIKSQYRKMLKLYHPDKQNTIQNNNIVLNNRQVTIDDITTAYKLLCAYFNFD